MDCWIASFPRSGNTFFRNILYYVYGIESSTFHKETTYPVDGSYDSYRFVKTHLLPEELIPQDPAIPAIYLVRDGRDAVVSIAHHRKDLIQPGSEFFPNLQEAIVAAEGSFFGGWSRNASAWLQRAQLVIRYEDLIKDPPGTFNRVQKLIHLPRAKWENLPTFEEMKSGKVKYGSGKAKYGGNTRMAEPKFKETEFAEKFFRKGKTGGWREEMPAHFQDLFWNYHGDMMERLGYETYPGSAGQNQLLDYQVMEKMGRTVSGRGNKKLKVYIEATKVVDPVTDGIKRYLEHLLKRFQDITRYGDPRWDFKLIIGRKIYPLENYQTALITEEIEVLHTYEKGLLGFKDFVRKSIPAKVYQPLATIYRKSNIRLVLRFIQQAVSLKQMKLLYKKLVTRQATVDLLHIPLPQNTENYTTLNHPMVVTVHDLTHKLFHEYHEKENIALAETGMQFIVEKNSDVIAVSQNTIRDLVSHYPIPENKIHRVYESPDQDLFRWNVNKKLINSIREKYKLGTAPYFLSLSTIEPRKNLPNTIRAFNDFVKENPSADVNLVISGSFGWKTEHLSEELHLDNPRILFTGYIDDFDLHVIYSEAIALCYVSFYEGFGLPPLEAMSCRTPVIYGGNSSMSEIIGEAGLPADANDVGSIKHQMSQMFFNKTLRDDLALKSHHRSFEFSWRKSVYDTLRVYEEIINRK